MRRRPKPQCRCSFVAAGRQRARSGAAAPGLTPGLSGRPRQALRPNRTAIMQQRQESSRYPDEPERESAASPSGITPASSRAQLVAGRRRYRHGAHSAEGQISEPASPKARNCDTAAALSRPGVRGERPSSLPMRPRIDRSSGGPTGRPGRRSSGVWRPSGDKLAILAARGRPGSEGGQHALMVNTQPRLSIITLWRPPRAERGRGSAQLP